MGYRFKNPTLLRQAFTRSSYRNEHNGSTDNEVLELIGDSVLSLTVLTWFREKYMEIGGSGLLTKFDEGQLSALKNGLVNKVHLAERMRKLNLSQYLVAGKGDIVSGVQNENSVLEDLFESIIGAIYIDSDCDFATVGPVVREMLDIATMPLPEKKNIRLSYKNELQERTQKQNGAVPVYRTVEDKPMPNNSHRFTVECQAFGKTVRGYGKKTKSAEEDSAKNMIELLDKEKEN